MSRPDAERALNIYKQFAKQTDQVVQYLSLARQYQNSTRLEVPKLKHAPTTLTTSLEEYLNDPDFEINRRQYLAQQEAKRRGSIIAPSKQEASAMQQVPKTATSFPPPPGPPPGHLPKGPAPDLIDFFESIEQNQQPMAQPSTATQPFSAGYPQAQQYVQPPFIAQPSGYNSFVPSGFTNVQSQTPLPSQQDYTSGGFGGYAPPAQPNQTQSPFAFQPTLSSIPPNSVASFHSQQVPPVLSGMQSATPSTNPFRQSVMSSATTATTANATGGFASAPPGPTRQSTNPFAKSNAISSPASSAFAPYPQQGPSPFASATPQTQPPDLSANSALFGPLTSVTPSESLPQPLRTGTNPFAKNRPSASVSGAFVATNATGSTNPFRQSAFVNQQTGQGWQNNYQGTLSGFNINQVETVPVFPRPGQQ